MEKVTQQKDLDFILKDNSMVLTYFSGANCNVCASLKPKIEMLVHEQFPDVKIVEVPTDLAPELVGRYSVFTVPVVMFWVDGREYIREARSVSVLELSKKMEKIVSLYN